MMHHIETGFFENGLPFAKLGDKPHILLDIEALSFKHEPVSGPMLKYFIKSHEILAQHYTVFLVGRRPDLPQNYTMEDMAKDYAWAIRKEFKKPVDIMGISTGGQIAQYLAADHPDTVDRLIIISSAYRLSDIGKELERQSAAYFIKGEYGRSLAVMMDFTLLPGPKRSIIQSIIKIFGKWIMGKIKYPNDFLIEVKADREMDFKERLKEIKARSLVMSGDLDIAYSKEDVIATAEAIPFAELLLYKGYGHNLSMINYKQLQKDILTFFKASR